MTNRFLPAAAMGATAMAMAVVVGDMLLPRNGAFLPRQTCASGDCPVAVTVVRSGLFGCSLVVPDEVGLQSGVTHITWTISPNTYKFKSSGATIVKGNASDFTAVPLTSAQKFQYRRNPPTSPGYEYELHVVPSGPGMPACAGPDPTRLPRIKNE